MIATWLGCHRRAFEAFGDLPSRVIIDNCESAITRVCYFEPEVQCAFKKLAYDQNADIAPVSLIAQGPNVPIVNAASPFKTLATCLKQQRRRRRY